MYLNIQIRTAHKNGGQHHAVLYLCQTNASQHFWPFREESSERHIFLGFSRSKEGPELQVSISNNIDVTTKVYSGGV